MLANILSIALATTLASASPTPHIQPRQNASQVILKITNFKAFMADPYIDGAQSNLSFHITDTRPLYHAEIDCVVPPTYFNLYAISALFDRCGNMTTGFDYRYSETGLTVRRGWKVDNNTYIQGSSTQSTSWTEEGAGANITSYPDGKLFERESEWLFPLTRLTTGIQP